MAKITAPPKLPAPKAPPGVTLERDVAVQMSDGVKLLTNVFRPSSGEGPWPVILSVSPYGKDQLPYPWAYMPHTEDRDFGDVHVSDYATFEAPDPGFWVPKGYLLVHGDVRGQRRSEGTGSWLSARDAQDLAELVEWAGTQSFSTGRVGLCGVSYLAMSQWQAAALDPPHLTAMIPWEGASDQYREFVLQGGLRETEFFPSFYQHQVRAHQNPDYPAGEDLVEGAKEHPLDGPFWAPMRPALEAIRTPALVCVSWSDQGMHTRGSLEGFTRIASAEKWMYTHGRKKWEMFYSDDAKAAQLRFFEHFLKDAGTMDGVPPVRLEVRHTETDWTVRDEPTWPVPGTRLTPWYLDAATGGLVGEPVAGESSVAYPADRGRPVQAATFTIQFEKDTELTGNMALRVWLSVTGADDADLFVGVRKFDASGAEVHFIGYQGHHGDVVAKGWLRASQRELDPARSRPDRPWHTHTRIQKLADGEPVAVEVEILPSATRFEAGSSLRLDVQDRDLVDYPGFGHADTVNRGEHRLHSGGQFDSYLMVPVIER